MRQLINAFTHTFGYQQLSFLPKVIRYSMDFIFSGHVTLYSPGQTRITLKKTVIMSCFTLLHRLLYFWEICSSFSHAIRYSIKEAIRLQLIKPQSYNTTDIPPMMQDSNHGIQKLPSITIMRFLLITSSLTIILILKASRLGARKRNSTNIRQY